MPVDRTEIPFNRPFIAGKELYYIARAVMVHGQLSAGGPFTKRCQEWMEKRLASRRAFLTHSCSAALETAAILCDIRPGDEVVMPSFTFVSTASAFALRGGVPVFVDIRPDTLNIDETLIEDAVTPRTRAVVPVHYAGVPCAMEDIGGLARKYGLWVVEDAAHALLSTCGGRHLGTLGHLGCLSFHETKNIISGEGGALLVNDERLVDRAEVVLEKGTDRRRFFRGEVDRYTWVDLGSSYMPGELVSAFLCAQLEQAEAIVSARRRIFDRYCALLTPLEQQGAVQLPHTSARDSNNGHLFYLLTGSLEERDGLIRFLREQDIWAVFHYVPLHSSPAGRKYGRSAGTLPVTDDISRRLVRLPLYYEMREEDTERVAEAVRRYYGPGA